MWYVLYNVLLIAASPIILLILLAKQRCRRGLPQRLGFSTETVRGGMQTTMPVIWVHAVSLGEVVAAVPLVRELHTRRPDCRIIVTTVTETGREAVEQRLAGVAEHRYAPLDFPWVVSRVVDHLNPVLFLFVETELWPNLLRALSRRGVPSLLINGRLSSNSFRGYRMIRPLIRRALLTVNYCLMQSDRDASRMRALVADPEKVLRTGNIKFDQPLSGETEADAPAKTLFLSEGEELIVAGSTHPGEEEQILSCYEALQRRTPSLVLLLAPRHIERASHVQAAAGAKGFVAIRRSMCDSPARREAPSGPPKRPRVVILDTRGELATVYRYAVLAFVGGTLVPVGGHNLLEPALWGKPVLFGPHTDHCAEIADLLLQAGGARRVQNGEQLAEEMAALLEDRPALERMGQAARTVVMENRGALKRTLDVIMDVLRAPYPAETGRDHARETNNRARNAIDSLVH
jgi:3-deoxy-D-manno-octulosonic-acid transferase